MMKKLSIVVPVFNEQENIHEFYRRVTEVMAPLSYDYELLFIDDGSRDQSAAMIRELADKDPHVEGYLFSRNYGHQLALTCGLEHAKGDAVISMDGDLQHPREMIPELAPMRLTTSRIFCRYGRCRLNRNSIIWVCMPRTGIPIMA